MCVVSRQLRVCSLKSSHIAFERDVKAVIEMPCRQEQAAEAQQSVPVLYEATVLSPKLMGEAFGLAHSKTQASMSALSSIVNNLVKRLEDMHKDK